MKNKMKKTLYNWILPSSFTIHEIRKSYSEIFAQELEHKHVVISFAHVESIDLTGIQLFLSTIKTIVHQGGEFSLEGPVAQEIMNIFYTVGIHSSEDAHDKSFDAKSGELNPGLLESTLRDLIQDRIL